MKVKRLTIEVEVPIRTVSSNELFALVNGYLNSKAIPHQSQVKYEISPNTRIGDVTEFDASNYYFYTNNGVYIRTLNECFQPDDPKEDEE